MEKTKTELVPLQKKSYPPYMALESGYGYQGVVLWDSIEDKVQCAECGQMFDSLSNHVRTHDLTTNSYREKFGLNTRTPLSSMKVLKMRKENGYKNWDKNLRGKLKFTATSEEMARRGRMRKGNTSEFDNSKSNCKLQLNERFDELCEQLDRIPTKSDLTPALYFAIYRRYGGYNRYLEARGLPLNKNHPEKEPAHQFQYAF